MDVRLVEAKDVIHQAGNIHLLVVARNYERNRAKKFGMRSQIYEGASRGAARLSGSDIQRAANFAENGRVFCKEGNRLNPIYERAGCSRMDDVIRDDINLRKGLP